MLQLRRAAMRQQQEHLHSVQAALNTTTARLNAFNNLPPDLQASKKLYEDKVARLQSCRQALEECLARL